MSLRKQTNGKTNKTLWDYFEKGDEGENAKCLLCSAILKISQRSRKGLVTHLKSRHCIDLKSQSTISQPQASTSRADHNPMLQQSSQYSQAISVPGHRCEDEIVPKKKAKTIDNYFKKENSMEKMISRMIAKDGFTFNSFSTSLDLKYLFSKSGFQLPTSANTIRSIVINFSNSVKADMVKEFNSFKIQNQKFSLTFDEWTSQKNQRYLNINLHCKGKHFNLGLIRIHGSCTAEHCIKIVEERLKDFNLNLKNDVIGITTDGASVMVKVGKLMPCYQQLCYAHGIQLAAIDILYKKNTEDKSLQETEINFNTSESEDEDENYDDDINVHGLTVTLNQPPAEVISNYKDLTKKVRKVVKIFKNSPTKNDTYLQKYVQEEQGKPLGLILDCKTRWNSLLNMLERFYNLRLCISKALIDLKSEIQFTDDEWFKINDLIFCLEPLKLGLEVLCRRESTLITADTTFRFILEKLDKQNTVLSNDLAMALRTRIIQRRTDLTGILIYLQNPKKYDKNLKTTDNTFGMPKKTLIRQEIKKMLERVLNNDISKESDEESNVNVIEVYEDHNEQSPNSNLSLQEELEIQLQNEKKECETKEIRSLPDFEKVLKKEMASYESDGIRGKYLSMAYGYLMTLTPTSVEAERAFSAAGYICSSLRSRLGDDTINSICFLRSYFQQ